uniref:Uncharacterized protein n=1 Tax=Candidatus Kentrum sp. SD TaxID=2126332 RepID=A0A450YAJ9_9GAMM|nr:MAG: hypothetical protein BECKSD772F_GA0070984_10261 [Candidatus Kentron sp. SD]VFK41020.1 MAG: hypothetical protein BECKSD772E_GA0070983_10095 [Candidatus Kentron sp. SD]
MPIYFIAILDFEYGEIDFHHPGCRLAYMKIGFRPDPCGGRRIGSATNEFLVYNLRLLGKLVFGFPRGQTIRRMVQNKRQASTPRMKMVRGIKP